MTVSALAVSVVVLASCGSTTVGERETLDEDRIIEALQDAGFNVPSGFEFGQAYQYAEFVGEPSRWARFDGPSELGDGRAVSMANPTYPAMTPAECDETKAGNWSSLGYVCTPGTIATQFPPRGAMDTVTAHLNHDQHRSHLFVHSSGH
ncbi:hypothetical protein [Rhodococcus sp. NPDC058521]|uniref:hypothetical protein n=1 Tax=Rhodococcus sp. NPDC058521 TaxID=3346536 RepID=UPI003653849F